jgi:hypothetical protein
LINVFRFLSEISCHGATRGCPPPEEELLSWASAANSNEAISKFSFAVVGISRLSGIPYIQISSFPKPAATNLPVRCAAGTVLGKSFVDASGIGPVK